MTVTTPAPSVRDVPGPRGRWPVGNAPSFRRGFLHAMTEGFRTYGDLVRFRIADRTFLIASHPDLAQHVLVDHAADFPKREASFALGLLLGDGLVTNADHASWLAQRRMMQPMFHRARLAAMGDKMSDAAGRLVTRLEEHAGRVVDVADEMNLVTLDVITRTMFSADLGGEAGRVGPAVSQGTRFVQARISQPFTPPLAWPTPANLRFRRQKGVLDAVVDRLIAARRESGEVSGDLLDMLLEARDEDTGGGMTDAQLRDEVLTVFSAGHETTANTLTLAWWLLSRHPEVRFRLHGELDRVLGGRLPTADDLTALPYTRAVLEETMRLFPAAAVTSPRRVVRDTALAGYRVPAEVSVFVSIYNIHHHPDVWGEPEVFDPGRFLDGERPAHRFAYLPFGAGARKCIGSNLAMMEGTLILAAVASRFDLVALPGHEVDLELAITLRARGGLPMTVRLRP